MTGAIVSIGDELLIGQVVNTNASSIAQQMHTVGIDIRRVTVVGDTLAEIVEALGRHLESYDVVLVTGGLGPTHDDVTRTAVCTFFGTSLVRNAEALDAIHQLMEQRGAPWTPALEDQAMVPEGATIIPNRHGTAPGYLFERGGKLLVVMPGVPYEMEGMMEEFVVPFFQRRPGGDAVLHRTLNTTGIGESLLAELIGDLGFLPPTARLAFLPSPTGTRLRISVIDADRQRAEETLRDAEAYIRVRAERYIYSTGETNLESVVGSLLRERGLRIAVAESCTGGLITHRITNVPGSSDYFERGVIAYSNQSKRELLRVPEELIRTHGAVSRDVAEAMAAGIRTLGRVDIGLSTTGIAGPGGGTPAKPVGLVWIGYADAEDALAVRFTLGEGRLRVKERAAQAAFNLLRRKLLKIAL